MAARVGSAWAEMNCILNPKLEASTSFRVTDGPPPTYTVPAPFDLQLYLTRLPDGTVGSYPSPSQSAAMIKFIHQHDRTASGNITELTSEFLTRIQVVPCIIGLLYEAKQLVGTIFTFLFRTAMASHTESETAPTAYTTLLCVDRAYRERGLAMILIRATTVVMYQTYGSNDGYYLTATSHHPIHNPIQAWYRPVNVRRAIQAGFDLPTFVKPGDRGRPLARQELAYRISKPSVLPVRARVEDYDLVLALLRKGQFYLAPSQPEYVGLLQAFDCYLIGKRKLLLLFPMTTVIGETSKRVRNAQIAVMIGDALSEALWIAQEDKYDLVYGWLVGEMTRPRIEAIKGLVASGSPALEFYNFRAPILNAEMMVPIF